MRDCRNLGRFKLKGLPPMPAGLPKVEVNFLVDANGILTVTALEQRSAPFGRFRHSERPGFMEADATRRRGSGGRYTGRHGPRLGDSLE